MADDLLRQDPHPASSFFKLPHNVFTYGDTLGAIFLDVWDFSSFAKLGGYLATLSCD